MKKINIKSIIAIMAMLFLVNNTSWGQWGNGIYNLSSLSQGGTYDYYAGTNPAIKVSSTSRSPDLLTVDPYLLEEHFR